MDLAKGTMSLFFPANCVVCKTPLEPLNRSFICWTCWQNVEWLRFPHCSRCGKPFPFTFNNYPVSPQLCLKCQTHLPHFQKLFTPTIYRGVMAEAIRLFKYSHKRGILRGFARIIKHYVNHSSLASVGLEAVVPVPLHPRRLRDRGFNQAEDLAVLIGKYLNLQVWKNYVVRVRDTLPQTQLKSRDREQNIKGAFAVKKKIQGRGKTLLVVDDVYTTGVTLNELCQQIKKCGEAKVFAFTLARTP